MHQLSLTKDLFASVMADLLKDLTASLQSVNRYADTTILLAVDKRGKFLVRANIWKDLKTISKTTDLGNNLWKYLPPHDHSFNFMTVGYFGPGYATRLYEYDRDQLSERLGEPVDLRFIEETKLPMGKVMFYRQGLDVHSQIPPDSLSISINLLTPGSDPYFQGHVFDVDNNSLAGFVEGVANHRVALIELAGEIGSADFIEPLFSIARNVACPRTRAQAAASILKLAPDQQDRLLSYCGSDKSPLVKEILGSN
jgi:hypothetical protein